MLKLWNDTRKNKDPPHVMVPLKARFKGNTKENWHMLLLADTTGYGIKVKKWVGRWLDVLVEKEGRLEYWFL